MVTMTTTTATMWGAGYASSRARRTRTRRHARAHASSTVNDRGDGDANLSVTPATETLTVDDLRRQPRAVVGDISAQNAKAPRAVVRRTAVIGVDAAPPAALTRRDIDYGGRLGAAVAGLGLAYAGLKAKQILDTPSRTYIPGENTVGAEYDAWTEEEILEYYWGEHIHLGYYSDADLAKGAGTLLGHKVKDFIEAKEDFVDEMYKWSGVEANNGGAKPMTILDVGCGIGGATRRLASKCVGGDSRVTGITLSQKQADRATALAKAQGIPNAEFKVMDALNMTFPDNSFDMVWACESGEHMPDKKKYVEEMVRVLKPGGTLVIATWCQRHAPPELTAEEKGKLQFLYDEWAHPYFISIKDYCALAEGTGAMTEIDMDDWTKQTIVSWRHSIWAGVYDPLPVFTRPKIYYKTLRDIICLERMQRAFAVGLMQYGMIKGVKKAE